MAQDVVFEMLEVSSLLIDDGVYLFSNMEMSGLFIRLARIVALSWYHTMI